MKKLPRQRTKEPLYETRKSGLTSALPDTGTGEAKTEAIYVPEYFVTPKAYVASVGDTLMSLMATWNTCEADGSTCAVTATIRIYRTAEPAPTYDGHIRWAISRIPVTGKGTIGR